jgi:hypothetical protein
MFGLRKERIKQDILHIFLRFERVVSKEHGAFADFMSALRDALYIPNQDDLDWVRQCLRESGKNDTEINQKLRTEFDWCLRRIRRHVPSPTDLEKRYQEVIDLYSDVVDGNTEKPFFNAKAKNVHKATLKHIRRNCLSDIPGLSYYIQIGTDKLGIPLLKCCRGTSALEGLHQKLKHLIRGYANSPRYARALVFEFVYRWNHDLDVTARGLPKDYEHFYEGSALEREIQIMNGWSNDLDAHPHWVSAMAFKCTGEAFGIPIPASDDIPPDDMLLAAVSYLPGDDEDLLREIDAINASDTCAESDAGDGANKRVSECIEEQVASKKRRTAPASVAWLCNYSGRTRPMNKVQGKEEWGYFSENYMKYQDNGIGSVDNYSFVNWSAFANDWCQKVYIEEQEGKTSSFTYKNAAILKDAWKTYRRQANRATTMLAHQEPAKDLRKRLRDTETPAVQNIAFPDVIVPRPVATPPVQAISDDVDPLFGGDANIAGQFELPPTLTSKKRKRKRRKKDKSEPTTHHRCRKCGQEFNSDQWKEHHKPPESAKTSNLLYQEGNKPSDNCQVPPEQYVPGFPMLTGTMPRRNK